MLPREKPGLFPDDIYQKLNKELPKEIDGWNPDTVKMHIRAALKNMHTFGEVSRESARGPNGGSSYRYIQPQSSQASSSPQPHAPLPQQPPPAGVLPRDQPRRNGGTPSAWMTPGRWRSEEQDHNRGDAQPDIADLTPQEPARSTNTSKVPSYDDPRNYEGFVRNNHSSTEGPSPIFTIHSIEEARLRSTTRTLPTPNANTLATTSTLQDQADATVEDSPRNDLEQERTHIHSHPESRGPEANPLTGYATQNTTTSLSSAPTTHAQVVSRIGALSTQGDEHAQGASTAIPAAVPSQAVSSREPTVVSVVTSGQDKGNLDYGVIVQELQRLKKERKTLEQEVETERKALPDANALQKSADQATAREAEAARLAEGARQQAETERSRLKEALARRSRMVALDEQLQHLRQSSHSLRLRLDIDD